MAQVRTVEQHDPREVGMRERGRVKIECGEFRKLRFTVFENVLGLYKGEKFFISSYNMCLSLIDLKKKKTGVPSHEQEAPCPYTPLSTPSQNPLLTPPREWWLFAGHLWSHVICHYYHYHPGGGTQVNRLNTAQEVLARKALWSEAPAEPPVSPVPSSVASSGYTSVK